MALDFPSNPADGEIYGSYVYNFSVGVWQSREESAAPAITSPTRPLTAANGDIWYNTSNGITYVFYSDGSSGQWVEMVSSGVPSLEEVMPTGSVIQTARASAPAGWALCDGTSLLVANYQKLFNAIGYTYGGSGLNFNVPNLKGKIPVGYDATQTEFDALGEAGGSKATSLNVSHIPQHAHSIDHDHPSFTSGNDSPDHSHTVYAYKDKDDLNFTGNSNRLQGSDAVTPYDQGTSGASTRHQHSIDVPAFTGTSGNYGSASVTPVSALQPYLVMNYIIKV